jgi:NAD(P)-dependent dehydrogenase (short-subunit alcohol dehydrogenase family)
MSVRIWHPSIFFQFFISYPKDMAEGKVALVTGSAQGIGRAIALELAARGADVVVNDFNNVNMNETVELVKEKGRRCLAFDVDISDRDQVEKMMNDVVEHFGHLDIVVGMLLTFIFGRSLIGAANAYYSIREPLLTADWDNVKKTLEVTQFGTYHTCQLAAQKMVKNTTGGKIVIIGLFSKST